MKVGLQEFGLRGVRFFASATASTYLSLRAAVSPASNLDILLPSTLPGTTSALTMTPEGQLGYSTLTISTDIPILTSAFISDFNTAVRSNRLDQLTAPTATVSFGGQILSNVATPVANSDAANKGYVDSVIASASSGGGEIFSTTIDFGSTPSYSLTTNITHNGAVLTDRVMISISANMPPDVDLDELEMDSLIPSAYVSALDTITIIVNAIPGPITGQRNFNYQIN
jgi:hypothetical protein